MRHIDRVPVDGMTFAPQWTFGRLAEDGDAGPVAFLVPPGQHLLRRELADEFGQDAVLGLDTATAVPDGRLVFVSRTSWSDGVSDENVTALLRLVNALDGRARVRLDVVTDKAVGNPLFPGATHPVDGVHIGLAQTLARERPEWTVRCFCLWDLSAATLARTLRRALPTVPGKPVCVRGDEYAVAGMAPVALGARPAGSAFRRGGTYVILGGTGGIGSLLAEHLAEEYQAEVVIVGRRDPELVEPLRRRLRDLGAAGVHYHQVDLTDGPALRRALDAHEVINGVVHSALVLEDAALATMTERVLLKVLAPKLHGTHNLVAALRGRELDFCLFFSSVQAYLANAGQANYTAACVAKDAYADLLRNALLVNAKVVNWGYWGSVGVVATPAYRERMDRLGVGSIEADEGLAVIERFLAGERRQITVVKGTREALERMEITPHEPNLLDAVVPPFELDSPEVSRNRELAAQLDSYTRWRLGQVPLPARAVQRHEKLLSAIRAIPVARSAVGYPELAGHAKLLDACLDRLPDVLRGAVDPLDVLFPDGSFELVAPVYRDNPIADSFNRVSARVVADYQRRVGRVRVLEVGAGTGSTTQFVLPLLDPREASYTFTDLSHAFLNKARDRFSDYPFVRYEICDIEHPPAGEFDVVVATNVLHATSDVPRTLRNVRGLLREGGILVLSEITARQDYATLTFGLTEGWWLSDDPYRIEHTPLLSGAQWQRLLSEAGFGQVRAHGGEEQQVMVALAGAAEDSQAPAPDSPASETAVADRELVDPAASDDAVRVRVEEFVREVIAETMRFELSEVERDRPFRDMGIDSLISMELVRPLRERVGYLPATVLFEYPTVARLAEHLVTEHGDAVRAGFSAAVVDSAGAVLVRVEEFVREVIAETMRFELSEVERDRPFRDMGIDSLISMELVRPLRERVGYLPATVLFEYPTVARLAEHLVTEHGDAVRAGFAVPTAFSVAEAVAEPVEEPVAEAEEEPLRPRPGDIAIIGIAARLPKARNVTEFWQNLLDGVDCTSPVPDERWTVPLAEPRSYTDKGAFVDDIDAFDHTFFNLTPHDAATMDPQERLLLEQTYRAVLDAGYSRTRLAGSDTGVFVGVMNGAYAWHTAATPAVSTFWSMANRASYHFDWHGPSMAVDTACSASLTALHLACQSLRAGECDQAVVGGVNLITHPRQYELLCGMGMLSPTGVCRAFGADADGFVDGEGVVTMVLKPAEQALRDQDRVYAVIAGSAINADGRANGFTAPNLDAQQTVITKALAAADLSADEVGYVEAHGTGTELGDPIELRALSKAYAAAGTQRIRLGSVKSAIGHLESAAGLSGVLKAVLQMRNRRLVPSLHAERTNPHLDFTATPFTLNTAQASWPPSLPLVSAVSSFGAGGANAHVLLRGVPASTSAPGRREHDRYVIPLSNHTSAGLQLTMDALRGWLSEHPVDMDALAYTLASRDTYKHRVAIVCRDQDELVRELGQDLARRRKRPAPNDQRVSTAEDIAALYESGGAPDWARHYDRTPPISLPEYVFLRHRHWVDSAESRFGDPSTLVAAHRINGETMAPAAWSLAVLAEKAGGGLADVVWHKKITTPEAVELRQDGRELSLVEDGAVCCTAELADPSRGPAGRAVSGASRFEAEDIYATFRRRGYDYGEPLRGVRWAEVGTETVRAFLHVDRDWGHGLSPALLDAGMQLSILLTAGDGPVFVPYHLGRLTIARLPRDEAVFCHCVARPGGQSARTRTFDFAFTDADGNLLIGLEEAVSIAIGEPARPAAFTVFELT